MMLPTHPRISKALMQSTWLVGGIGLFFGLNALSSGQIPAAVRWVALWSVGGVGLLSFVRHAVFHRSDAVRMGWDLGRRNDFQIEVGFANLAWGVVAVVASCLNWGTMALGSLILVFGIYMLQAAVLPLLLFCSGLPLRCCPKQAIQGFSRIGPADAGMVYRILRSVTC